MIFPVVAEACRDWHKAKESQDQGQYKPKNAENTPSAHAKGWLFSPQFVAPRFSMMSAVFCLAMP